MAKKKVAVKEGKGSRVTYRCQVEGFLGTNVARDNKLECQACGAELEVNTQGMTLRPGAKHTLLSLGEMGVSE